MIVTKCIDRDIYNYNHGYSIWTGKDRTGGPNLRRGLETSSKRSLQRREKKGKERRKLIIRGSPSISLLPYRSVGLKGLPASSHEWGKALSQSHSDLVLQCSAQALSQLRQIGGIRLILLGETANWFAKLQANWQINSLGAHEERKFLELCQRNNPKNLRILHLWSAGQGKIKAVKL